MVYIADIFICREMVWFTLPTFSLEQLRVIITLTHFLPLISFDTLCFQGVSKEISGMKWVKGLTNCRFRQFFKKSHLQGTMSLMH